MKSSLRKTKETKGIVATLFKGVRSIYRKGPRQFYFDTLSQAPVEQAMCIMGFGADQYCLSFGLMQKVKYDDIYKKP